MQAGFQLHKSATMIELNLNRFIDKATGKKHSEVADITMVYDQPVRFSLMILQEVVKSKTLKERDREKIKEMQERYHPYVDCILSQLDHGITSSLCQDLAMLCTIIEA